MKAHRIVVVNHKGGVGKTTTAVNVAHGLALRGFRVLLADFDPQGQCAIVLGLKVEGGVEQALTNETEIRQWFRITRRDGLELLPGDRGTVLAERIYDRDMRPIDAISDIFRPVAREFDYMVFDTSNHVGGIQERVAYAADLVLVPSRTASQSIDGVRSTIEMLKKLHDRFEWDGKLLGILPTFYGESEVVTERAMITMKDEFQGAILSPIHYEGLLLECPDESKTIFEKDPASRPALEYEALVKEIVLRS